MEMEVSQSLVPEGTSSLTIQVSQEQESAMEAFFQINSWQLIKEVKGRAAAGGDGSRHSLTIRVTSEQEAAMEAFFQINNWTLIKEVDAENVKADETTLHIDSQGQIVEPENVQPQQEEQQQQQPQQSNVETLVEEVQGLHEVQVTAQGANGQPQIITVYTEGGNAQGLPESLLTDGSAQEGREIPQVIIQEITLPDGMSLDQGLVIANPHPSIRRVTPRGSVKPGDKIHKCHVCGKTFKQAQSFNGHYQSHFGAKPYQCEICHTGFTLKAALVAHHSIHTGAKPFTCSLCNKGFRRKDDMISHIRTHTGEKPYECDICGKKFKYRNQIPKHRRAHTGEKPYKCDVCGKCFTSNIHLRRHERTHTGERPYKCTVCPKAFTQYGHLQAHMRIHTDERPFECSVCGRGFREKKVMKKHETLHTSERPYKCDVCGKGFLRQSNLELHAVMHQKESKDGVRVRPRPRPKKRQPDAEMREFVASVLCNVKKVDSGMQTDNLIHGVPTDDSTGADNLSAFVNFAVEQQIQQGTKIEPISDIQNAVTGNDQYTLVMQDDGSEGYLIANYDGSAVAEEIVTMSSQQVEISTGYEVSTAEENVDTVTYTDNPSDIISKALEKAVGASHAEDEESSQHGFLSSESQPDTNIVLDIKQEFSEPAADLSQGQSAGVEGKGQSNENLPESHGDTNTTVVDQFQTPKCKITLVK